MAVHQPDTCMTGGQSHSEQSSASSLATGTVSDSVLVMMCLSDCANNS